MSDFASASEEVITQSILLRIEQLDEILAEKKREKERKTLAAEALHETIQYLEQKKDDVVFALLQNEQVQKELENEKEALLSQINNPIVIEPTIVGPKWCSRCNVDYSIESIYCDECGLRLV
jgi:hypothetical protein